MLTAASHWWICPLSVLACMYHQELVVNAFTILSRGFVITTSHEFWHCLTMVMNLQHGGRGAGFIPIQEYGSEFHKGSKQGTVRLLYTGRNHYDLLVWLCCLMLVSEYPCNVVLVMERLFFLERIMERSFVFLRNNVLMYYLQKED